MYVIRFTVRKSSPQRTISKHAYLRREHGSFKVGGYGDGGCTPIRIEHATPYNSPKEATDALIEYLRQIGVWDRKMWVRNPVIVQIDALEAGKEG
jgi:hypothetical protein